MRIETRSRRSGFTLLEVLLASLISVFLLGGLYVAFDVTFRQTQEARNLVDTAARQRAVFNKMAQDLSMTLSPLPPKSGGNSSGTAPASTSTASSATTPTATGTTGGTTATATPSTTASTDTTSSDATAAAADVPFQAGVIGSDFQMTIFVSRVPFALGDANTFARIQAQDGDGTGTGSDLVRVTYWMANGGSGPLCRQERPWVTADGVRDSTDPDTSDEAGDVIVDDVTAIQFEYFDGSSGSWTNSWDGSTPGADGVTPMGPPRAVRVTLTIDLPGARPNDAHTSRTVVQVIPIRTSAGLATPPLLDTGSGDTSSTSSTTTTTGAK